MATSNLGRRPVLVVELSEDERDRTRYTHCVRLGASNDVVSSRVADSREKTSDELKPTGHLGVVIPYGQWSSWPERVISHLLPARMRCTREPSAVPDLRLEENAALPYDCVSLSGIARVIGELYERLDERP